MVVRVWPVAFAFAGAACMAVIYYLDPRVQGNYPECLFFGLTGWHCPGCGTLRALHALMHGDFTAALGYNLLAVLCLPFLAYSFLSRFNSAFALPPLPSVFIPSKWIWIMLAAMLAYAAVRNLPLEPFSVLAP